MGRGRGKKLTANQKQDLRDYLKEQKQEIKRFLSENMKSDGELDPDLLPEYQRLTKDVDENEYKLHRELSPTVSGDRWKGDGVTELTSEEAAVARKDMLSNKTAYMAIKSAEHGVAFESGGKTLNTAIDDLYESNPSKLYNRFNNTREMLRKKYGDQIVLYRAGTSQTAKPTINMTTSRENAQSYAKLYGSRVERIVVPVERVLCVNVSRNGRYEEVIVLSEV